MYKTEFHSILCLIHLWLILVANLRLNFVLIAVCNFERGGAWQETDIIIKYLNKQ